MKWNKKNGFELLWLIVVTLVLYWPSFFFDFVNFDDQLYVLNNGFIINPSLSLLLDGSGTGNFHPLTMVSLKLDHILGGGAPITFHITNFFWHLFNSILVMILIRKLFPKIKGSAFFAALVFAIHPMHIESVAWISSRKDVLYTFFYLVSLLSYVNYISRGNTSYIVFTIIAAFLSLLSKPAAITLPIALLLIHFYIKRKVELKNIIGLPI
ncbi:glycosyltransferase family 39 protein [Lentimicrobium sp. S6]|uniref:glycosyltransferase family 39 protein n=1 Tax=Lentimicrobium sp. S6 TaxID=2735872 RepID=UPI0015541267|nr:glycosyltransferase family 39 protein [Lentimicrobium sp. S6]NPD48177.1 hypothetical protein [Lentimicrobium sp. S6]